MCSRLRTLEEVASATIEKLSESGLTEVDMKKMGVVPLFGQKAKRETGIDVPCFRIPYFDTLGNKTGFSRYRNFPNAKGIEAKLEKAKPKYTQLPNTDTEVYFAPTLKAEWKRTLKDAKEPIIVTEGELKAACACKMGFTTIGLGGVWCFQSMRMGKKFLPALASIFWRGRKTYICFDSDAEDKSGVAKAEQALAAELSSRGALVYVVRLPKLPKNQKTGLDDFLCSKNGGPTKLRHALAQAALWQREVVELNEELLFIKNKNEVLQKETGQFVSVNTLRNLTYANRFMKKLVGHDKDDRPKYKEVLVVDEWLAWKDRDTVYDLEYLPGQPLYATSRDPLNNVVTKYNLWKGWGSTPKKGDVKPWIDLLDFLFKDVDKKFRKWFEQWIAYPIRYPGTKLYSSVIMWSCVHGVGKSLVAVTLKRLYGAANCGEISDMQLEGRFNSWVKCKQFIVGAEMSGDGRDKRRVASRIKAIITDESARVEEKGRDEYEMNTCFNCLFNSNHSDSLYLEKHDRRLFVHEVVGAPETREFYQRYDDWMRSEDAPGSPPAGIAALFYHLIHDVDLAGFDPKGPAPMTEAKEVMVEESRSDVAQWAEELVPDKMLRIHRMMSSEDLLLIAKQQGRDTWTKNTISRALRSAGFVRPLGSTQQLRLEDGKQVRPWLIDRTLRASKYANQADARNLWYSDRKSNDANKKKFKKT